MDHTTGPQIQHQHIAGNIGEVLVRQTFLEAGVPVISVSQEDDYGTDLLAQAPHEGTNLLSGKLVRIQVKCGKSKYHRNDGTGRCYLDAGHRAYYREGPIPSILVTVDPDSKRMQWGNITEQLRNCRELRAVSAPHPFSVAAVPGILRIAKEAAPGDWALTLASGDATARKIAIEGCLLTAHQDSRVLDLLRAWTPRMDIEDISFLSARIQEEGMKHIGQQSLMDFSHRWGSELETRLPAERSYWQRPPYSKDLFEHLVSRFAFSLNDLLEIIERNENLFQVDISPTELKLLESAAFILDLHPAEHAEILAKAFFVSQKLGSNYTALLLVKALELDSYAVERSCEREGIRVLDVISAACREEPEVAAMMWGLWTW